MSNLIRFSHIYTPIYSESVLHIKGAGIVV